MGDEQGRDAQRGLGKVVYSTEPAEVLSRRMDESGPTDPTEEASEESFPASDPPGYATGTAEPTTTIAPPVGSTSEHDRTEGGG